MLTLFTYTAIGCFGACFGLMIGMFIASETPICGVCLRRYNVYKDSD